MNDYDKNNLINTFILYDPTEPKKRKAEDNEVSTVAGPLFSLRAAVNNPTKKKARLSKSKVAKVIYNRLKIDPLCMMTTSQANLAKDLGLSNSTLSVMFQMILPANNRDGSRYPHRFYNTCQTVIKKHEEKNNFISKIIVFRTVEVIQKITRAILTSFHDALYLEESGAIKIPNPFELKAAPQGVDEILESLPPITETFRKNDKAIFRIIYNNGACEVNLKMSGNQFLKKDDVNFSMATLLRALKRLFGDDNTQGGVWQSHKLLKFDNRAKKHRANDNIISHIKAEYYESMRQDIIAIFQSRLGEVLGLTKDDQSKAHSRFFIGSRSISISKTMTPSRKTS